MSSSTYSSYPPSTRGSTVNNPWLTDKQTRHDGPHVPPAGTEHIESIVEAIKSALSHGKGGDMPAPSTGADTSTDRNWVGQLNEICQARGVPSSRYILEPLPVENCIRWRCSCVLPEQLEPNAEFRTYAGDPQATKQAAKQSAARAALTHLV